MLTWMLTWLSLHDKPGDNWLIAIIVCSVLLLILLLLMLGCEHQRNKINRR